MLSVFGTGETSTTDAANIALSITRMTNYFKHNLAGKFLSAGEFTDIVKAFWGLIAPVYTYKWDLLPIEDKSICKLMGKKILPGYLKLGLLKEKMIKNSFSSSSSSTSLPSNTVVSPPLPTATSVTIPPLPTSVVATTRRNSTRSLLTSAKLSVGYLVVGITRELDKEPLLHCSSIYINYM